MIASWGKVTQYICVHGLIELCLKFDLQIQRLVRILYFPSLHASENQRTEKMMSSSLTLDGDMHFFSVLIYSLFLESGSTPAFRTGRWIIVQLCSSHKYVICALSIVQMHIISKCLLLRLAFGYRFGSRVIHRHSDVGGACILVIQKAGAYQFPLSLGI